MKTPGRISISEPAEIPAGSVEWRVYSGEKEGIVVLQVADSRDSHVVFQLEMFREDFIELAGFLASEALKFK